MENLLETITSNNIQTNIRFGDIIHGKKILVLSPHHDDEILGLAGTLLRYVQEGVNIDIIYITDGSKGVSKGEENVRIKEAVEVWKDYPGVHQHFLNIKDGELEKHEDEAVSSLRKILQDCKPNIIYTPWIFDRHRDHQCTTLFLKEATSDIDTSNINVACYEVMSPLFSNHTVNITKEYDQKRRLIDLYKSQHSYLNMQETAEHLNEFRASMLRLRSMKYAEGFFILPLDKFKTFIEKVNS